MNYIWNVLLQAKKEKIDFNDLSFIPAEYYSPYMEIAFDDINCTKIADNRKVEVNYWYRFYDIFKDLFNINNKEDIELREVLFDVIMHFLGELDLMSGINKEYFYKQLLLKDINNNIYGEFLKENIKVFSIDELNYFLDGLINQYKCNTSLLLLRKVTKSIFKSCIIYISKEKPKEIYVFLGEKYSEEKLKKINMILEVFMTINMKPLIFWDKHFGIMGVEDTMILDNMVMV